MKLTASKRPPPTPEALRLELLETLTTAKNITAQWIEGYSGHSSGCNLLAIRIAISKARRLAKKLKEMQSVPTAAAPFTGK